MNSGLSRSFCLLRSLPKFKSLRTANNRMCFKDSSSYNFCRRLTTGQTKDEARENALSAFKVWTQSGLGNQGCVDGYSNSGQEYEEHMDALDFSGPHKMAETAASVLKDNKDARILDAGAGSGLGGVALQYFGYTNIDAVDASRELLKLAEAKNVYCKIMCRFLGDELLPLEDGTYDMVVLSGAVGENHLPARAFDDLIRVVKPGGHVVNVYREAAGKVPWYGDHGLETHFAQLEEMGKWKRVSRILFPNFLTDMEGVVWIHRVLQ